MRPRYLKTLFIVIYLILSIGGSLSLLACPLRQQASAVPSTLPIYFRDYPGSLLGNALHSVFPTSDMRRLDWVQPIAENRQQKIQLLPENEAIPYQDERAHLADSMFRPLYRASLVIAADEERLGRSIRSWSELTSLIQESEDSLGLLVEPELLMAAMELADGSAEQKAAWLTRLAAVEQSKRFRRYLGSDVNSAWPLGLLAGNLGAQALPPILILWDYQAAQVNLKIGSVRYHFHLPAEGSLSLDFGLFSEGEKANLLVDDAINSESSETVAEQLIRNGYRLNDGRSPALEMEILDERDNLRDEALGYPGEEEYRQGQRRINNYLEYNSKLINSQVAFRRKVLGMSRFLPAGPEEEQLLLLLSIPVFFAWIASLYFRLDEDAIKRPMSLLLFWLGAAILLHFAQVMYTHSQTVRILQNMRFLPIFGMVDAWFYTGANLANSRGILRQKNLRSSWLFSLLLYGLAILFITNNFHGMSFRSDFYGRIVRVGPFFYLSLFYLLFLTFAGMRYLVLAQAKIRSLSLLLPGMVFLLILFGNLNFFFNGGTLGSSNFDLMNSLGAVIFMEACFDTYLIPANSGYFKLFRFSPVHLRLLSKDLETVYPEDKANLPLNDLKKIRAALQEQPEAQTETGAPLSVKDSKRPQILYNLARLRGAYLIWEDDISDILRLKNELVNVNSSLERQSYILRREQEFRSQHLSLNIRRRMLREIEKSLAQKMDEIRESLAAIRESSGDPDFVRHELSRVKVKVSQCKRKSNLLVRAEETIDPAELEMIFKEALTDSAAAGISGTAIAHGTSSIPVKTVLLLYDYVQDLLQKSVDLPGVSFFINYREERDHYVLNILYHSETAREEAFFAPDDELLPRFQALKVKLNTEREEGDANLRLKVPKEAADA